MLAVIVVVLGIVASGLEKKTAPVPSAARPAAASVSATQEVSSAPSLAESRRINSAEQEQPVEGKKRLEYEGAVHGPLTV